MRNCFLSKDKIDAQFVTMADKLFSLINEDTIIVPSFVDVHVHLREPGFFYKETIRTGTLAAAKSGYSHIFSMPNLNPVPDTLENLNKQLEIIERDALINVLPYGSITKGERGQELSDMDELGDFVIGYSDDGVGLNDTNLMKKAMLTAKMQNKPIVAHCEDLELRGAGYIHAGGYARLYNHQGISSESEYIPIKRDLKLAEETGCKYHVCHISTKESVELIRQAKKKGIDVTCETAPHYLILNDMDLKDDGRFKMNPPIRSEEDRQALIAGLKDGTIDMIATDHAPHSKEEKSRGLKASAMGITGLETAFPMIYTKLVKTGILTMEEVVKLMSINPRKRFGIKSAEELGDFCVWNIGDAYKINSAEFVSMGKATPFDDEIVYGKCLINIVGGKEVYRDNETALV